MSLAAPYTFFDRAYVYVNDIPYLQKGEIHRLGVDSQTNADTNHGFSPTGVATGVTWGNQDFSFSWDEYLVPLNAYTNLTLLLRAAPNTIITLVPYSLATGAPAAPQFTCTQVVPRAASLGMSQQGMPGSITRSFKCVLIPNL